MNAIQIMLEALDSLMANKIRSGLTILGIVIGVAAVIAIMALGRGAQAEITRQLNGIGSNRIYVMSGSRERDLRNVAPLTLGDARALADPFQAPDIAAVAPMVASDLELAAGGESSRVPVTGVTPEYALVENEQVSEGEFITLSQLNARSAVVVIGSETARKLFGRDDGVTGLTVRIEGQLFRVTGLLKPKGGAGLGSQAPDDRALVPLSTAQTRLMQRKVRDSVDAIETSASGAESVNPAVDEIASILRVRHHTKIGADDFNVMTQQQMLSTDSSVVGVMTLFLGGVAAISLLVGGIGIMNIMLVSVTERTREIGLRKAIGARKPDILAQFLSEAILLSLTGGLIGILLAWIIAWLVAWLASSSGTPFQPEIGLDAVALATLFSMAVGLVFGLYPANRAANLQPVEALRYE
jgi:putative ABC transport system permease protein